MSINLLPAHINVFRVNPSAKNAETLIADLEALAVKWPQTSKIVASLIGSLARYTKAAAPRQSIRDDSGSKGDRIEGHKFEPEPEGHLPKMTSLVGYDSLKRLIEERIVIPITYPSFTEEQRRGIWMYGPGGTGKTSWARAIGRETDLPFYFITPADVLAPYVGVAEENIKNAFMAAAEQPKGAIIFFDEADSLLGEGSHTQGILNAFKSVTTQPSVAERNIVIIVATNNPEKITDTAIKRRLETSVYVGLPTENDRAKLLKFYVNKRLSCKDARPGVTDKMTDIEYKEIGGLTGGLSPDELRRLVELAFNKTTPNRTEVRDLYYCPDRDRTMTVGTLTRPTLTPQTTSGPNCEPIKNVSELGKFVCWPQPTVAEFRQVIDEKSIIPATTIADLIKFYRYAVQTNDVVSQNRICEDINTFRDAGLTPAGFVNPC